MMALSLNELGLSLFGNSFMEEQAMSTDKEARPPLPPFTQESATRKVRLAPGPSTGISPRAQ